MKNKKVSQRNTKKPQSRSNTSFTNNEKLIDEQEIPDDEIFFMIALKKERQFFSTNVFEKGINSYLFWLSLERSYKSFRNDSNQKRARSAFELGVLNMYKIVGKNRIEELNASMDQLGANVIED